MKGIVLALVVVVAACGNSTTPQAQSSPGTNETPLLRVTRPGQTERIFSGPGCCSDAVADRFGIWFAVGGAFHFQIATIPPFAQAIYLYTKPSGAGKVSDFVGAPVGTVG
ncbi:MAG TPA: hypothetical protein VGU71_18025 [Candidatus Dormibacteraeota bacterium]|nr:hypothetical protein [Candidatus Dormibacteraeota bacterium]